MHQVFFVAYTNVFRYEIIMASIMINNSSTEKKLYTLKFNQKNL